MRERCPVCVAMDAKLSPLSALAYGFVMGQIFDSLNSMLDTLCPAHVAEYVNAMEPAALAIGLSPEAVRIAMGRDR